MKGKHRETKLVSGRWRHLSLALIGVLVGTLLLTPVGAHIGTPAHLWKKHIRPKADKRYVNAKKMTVAVIPFHDFVTRSDGEPFTYHEFAGISGNTGTVDVFAPVSLPDGATVKKVGCVFYDASASADVSCVFRMVPFDVDSVLALSDQLISSGDGGFQTLTTTNISNAVADNDDHAYYVQAGPSGGNWDGSDTAVKAAIVYYRTPATP